MNRIIIIVFIFVFPSLCFAQLYPLKPQTDRIAFKVIDVNGQLGLQCDTLPKTSDFPQILSITMENSDLLVHYKYKGSNKKYTRDVVKIISIQTGNERPVNPQRRDLRQEDSAVKIKKDMKGSIAWLDLGEEFLSFGEYYILTIERNIQLDVNCEDSRPQFKFKEQWPHYAVALVGGASVGLGQLYVKKKKDEYNLYEAAWRNGEGGSEASPFLEKAKDYDLNARIFTYAGYGILLVDAVWMWLRGKDKMRKQGLYDEFCVGDKGSSLRLQPMIESTVQNSSSIDGTGLKLVFQF